MTDPDQLRAVIQETVRETLEQIQLSMRMTFKGLPLVWDAERDAAELARLRTALQESERARLQAEAIIEAMCSVATGYEVSAHMAGFSAVRILQQALKRAGEPR